ncbi:spore germination protein [Schnuerera ultunensis]|uniref:spore germination protein n=1 Tax=Schnuerera ultunensis TaxID=45497 RepID=UPI00040B40F4|nr:spore germination protein [Schnuerera ultunensis]
MDQQYINNIKEKLRKDSQIRYREIGSDENRILVIYDNSITDIKFISESIILPIINNIKLVTDIEKIKREIIITPSVGDIRSEDEAIEHILSGDVVIIFSSLNAVIYCETKSFPKRAIESPPTEAAIKGSREGFNEVLADNVAAIRRRIKHPDLKIEELILGEKSYTSVAIVYIENNAPTELVKYIRTKINKIDTHYMIVANQIEEELKCKGTPFDTIGYSERPDVIAAKLGEGRVAIITDGTPFVIYAPFFFIENFHAPDDYTMNKFIANSSRLFRWASFGISALLPGIYIALFTYHFSLLPYIFVFRLAESRVGVPLPMVVELIIMLAFFQVLREAGIRLPQPIGSTLSIVGALILGDVSVQSGLSSHITVFVVALTSISSLLLPRISIAIFLWSIVIIIFSGFLGLPGFYMGFIIFSSHLAGLTSCGYPYLYPLGTMKVFKYKDIPYRGGLNRINNYIFQEDDVR